MTTSLFIIGASARAAAFSALRAGLTPRCADLFADIDLADCCEVKRVPGAAYPLAFRELVEAQPGPWLYTGALENHPRLIAELAQARPLWGNDAETLHACRRPERWTQVLRDANLPCPWISWQPDHLPGAADWLVKSAHSAGGVGIRRWQGEPLRPNTFLQQFVEGTPCSAIYLGDRGQAELLGVTRQLVGEKWLHAGRFRYCGSIGPWPLPAETRQHFDRLGQALVKGCGLRGLFGVDAVLAGEVPFPVEINPRYTASVEVLEYATGVPAMTLHQKVFEGVNEQAVRVRNRPAGATRHDGNDTVGKAILFAARDFEFPDHGPWLAGRGADPWSMPAFADIPAAGTAIRRGQPILTVLARAGGVADCQAKLRQSAAELDRMFGG